MMIRSPRGGLGPAVWAALVIMAAAGPARPTAVRPQAAPSSRPNEARTGDAGPVHAASSASEYVVRARVFILGDLGTVGSALLERRLDRTDTALVKTFRFSGRSKPELARKGRDIGGEFTTVTCLPLNAAGEVDQASVEAGRGVSNSYSGILAKNGVAKGEKVVFYQDHALAIRDDGSEKRLDGRFESLLAGFEFLLENPIRPGDVYRSRFILDGYPYIFKCEVDEPEVVEPFGVKAYRIDVTTFDGRRLDGRGLPQVVKKKGGIRFWLCKDGDHKNEFLRLRLHYKWYLTLIFDLKRTA